MLYPTLTFFLFEQFPSFIFLLKPFIEDREKEYSPQASHTKMLQEEKPA